MPQFEILTGAPLFSKALQMGTRRKCCALITIAKARSKEEDALREATGAPKEPAMGEKKTTQGRSPGERHLILQSADDIFEIAVKLGLFFFLVYWSAVLLRPFLSIALWSLILAVTLYPAFSWMARLLGGRRKLAAFLVTAISLLVFTGPIIWLGISMIQGVAELSHRLSAGD